MRTIRRRPAGWLFVGAALLAAAARADVPPLDAVPLPPGAISRTVAIDVVQNGRAISIATLDPATSIDEALAFYRDAWPAADDAPGHREARADGWSIISRLLDDHQLVVQLREERGGVRGLISVMSLAEAGVGPVDAPPLPPGARLLSTTSGRDAGRAVRTSVIETRQRPGETLAFYRDRLTRRDWHPVSTRTVSGTRVMLLTRRDARTELVVAPADGGGSVVVLNEVRGDG